MLNKLIGSDYNFSKRPPTSPGIPDFTCHLVGSLILVIEAKRKHVLEDMGEQTFPEFYNTSKGKDVIQQIYNYMGGNELGIYIRHLYRSVMYHGQSPEHLYLFFACINKIFFSWHFSETVRSRKSGDFITYFSW
ncbi:hypothetical protein RhiirA1_151243 [Rhizophagus irregularis]|uniref:Uncharacterized protein n=1 Tax=Rhizophagus irregularis TaxID=588596 RepID=A0A2N0QSV8_9GLOM|nr:hypothetical protein RhiirA1_151243 [Rhizophagus irregularis]